MAFPKVVAFDTDWTLWQRKTEAQYWGRGWNAPARPILEDNMERTDAWTIRDVTNPQNVWIHVFGDVSRIINDILSHGAQLAIVACNTHRGLSDRALYYFNAINPADNKEWSIIHLVKYNEVVFEPKTSPFRKIVQWAQCDPIDILHFDDEALNNALRIETAVTFKWCDNEQGVTWDRYQEALNHWNRVKNLTIPSNPNAPPERRIIGYSGLSTAWVNRVNVEKEGIVDTKFPYRWGYALYITDDVAMAKWYRDWELREGRVANVNEVWVKDYAAWCRINKIWIPENSGYLPQMNNTNWDLETTGKNQEYRDRTIENRWGIKTPYVMFCRHYWMNGVPLPPYQRMTEMIVYTQTHHALIEVVNLTNQQTDELIWRNRMPYPFHQRIAEWNITLPGETWAEEPFFFQMAR